MPSPKKVPVTFEAHGVQRVDNYYWMRDDSREDPEVLNHLNSENDYVEDWFASGDDIREELFEEITARIPKRKILFLFVLRISNTLEGTNLVMSMEYISEEEIRILKK